jgi:hypothetical protein
MGTKRDGQIDQWQGGSVTPPEHNLKRSGGIESRREERLSEPPPGEPPGREVRRSKERAVWTEPSEEESGLRDRD